VAEGPEHFKQNGGCTLRVFAEVPSSMVIEHVSGHERLLTCSKARSPI
jgi:hypothetical protein